MVSTVHAMTGNHWACTMLLQGLFDHCLLLGIHKIVMPQAGRQDRSLTNLQSFYQLSLLTVIPQTTWAAEGYRYKAPAWARSPSIEVKRKGETEGLHLGKSRRDLELKVLHPRRLAVSLKTQHTLVQAVISPQMQRQLLEPSCSGKWAQVLPKTLGNFSWTGARRLGRENRPPRSEDIYHGT